MWVRLGSSCPYEERCPPYTGISTHGPHLSDHHIDGPSMLLPLYALQLPDGVQPEGEQRRAQHPLHPLPACHCRVPPLPQPDGTQRQAQDPHAHAAFRSTRPHGMMMMSPMQRCGQGTRPCDAIREDRAPRRGPTPCHSRATRGACTRWATECARIYVLSSLRLGSSLPPSTLSLQVGPRLQ